MWKADWYLHCDVCLVWFFIDGDNKTEATENARNERWFVSASRCVCPQCKARHKLTNKKIRKLSVEEFKSL